MTKQEMAVINAEVRNHSGTGSARFLRKQGKIPAIIYGKGHDPISLTLSMSEFMKKYKSGSLSSHLIAINIDGNSQCALMRDVQWHVVKDTVEHVDFQFIDKEGEVKVDIPLHFINENKCPGMKLGGMLSILHRSIAVKCSPQNIPEFIEVDLSGKMIGQSIHASEIKLPEGAKLEMKEDDTTILVISAADSDVSTKEATPQS